jgi:NAD(P)-dependent dehydrogenase (short-subunit alcohol dehydrogenase family)
VDPPDRVGVIEPGALADLIVVDGDPLDDPTLLARPEEALRRSSGRQASPSTDSQAPQGAPTVNDAQDREVAFVTGAGSGSAGPRHGFVRRGRTVLGDEMRIDLATGRKVEGASRTFALHENGFLEINLANSVREAIAYTVATFGRLDAAFNAAGIDGEHGKPTAEATMENWERVLAVDLTGTFSCMRYELPAIVAAGGGAIVNCASVAGLRAAATLSAYTAAKHGVVGLTKAAAVEYARAGVRVHAICPGTVDTPMFRASMPPELVDRLVRTNPVGRLAEANEIADIALWLCDDATGYLTGQAITVDGGASS